MARTCQHIALRDFRVGQRHGAGDRVLTGNHFGLTATAHPGATGRCHRYVVAFQRFKQRGAHAAKEGLRRLQLRELHPAGRRFSYRREELLFEEAGHAERFHFFLHDLHVRRRAAGHHDAVRNIRHALQQLAAQAPRDKTVRRVVLGHQRHRIVAPFFGKNHIFRGTHAENHLHVGLRSVFRQPATHRHNRRHATTRRQQQEFIFRLVVTGKLALRVRQPDVIPALHVPGQPLGSCAVINTTNGERNVLAHARRGGDRVGAQSIRRITHAHQRMLARAVRIIVMAQQRQRPHIRRLLMDVMNLHPPRTL